MSSLSVWFRISSSFSVPKLCTSPLPVLISSPRPAPTSHNHSHLIIPIAQTHPHRASAHLYFHPRKIWRLRHAEAHNKHRYLTHARGRTHDRSQQRHEPLDRHQRHHQSKPKTRTKVRRRDLPNDLVHHWHKNIAFFIFAPCFLLDKTTCRNGFVQHPSRKHRATPTHNLASTTDTGVKSLRRERIL
jgi:hypothetical protein